MGSGLAAQVTTAGMAGRLARLSHPARLVLLVMALTAHDTGTKEGPAAHYWGGWPLLAKGALGYVEYNAAAHRAVARAIDELVSAGFVKEAGRRRGGRHGNAVYELTL